MELVSELEFVWTQVKNNTPSLSSSPSKSSPGNPRPQKVAQSTTAPMKVLSPMSEQDEAERASRRILGNTDDDDDDDEQPGSSRWSRRIERALVKLNTEVAALREQIATGREWRFRKEMSWRARAAWLFWAVVKHLVVDLVALSVVLIWMRKRKDRRLEDLVRAGVRLIREYVRSVVPAR